MAGWAPQTVKDSHGYISDKIGYWCFLLYGDASSFQVHEPLATSTSLGLQGILALNDIFSSTYDRENGVISFGWPGKQLAAYIKIPKEPQLFPCISLLQQSEVCLVNEMSE